MKKIITMIITMFFILSLSLPGYAMIDVANIDYNNYILYNEKDNTKRINQSEMNILKNRTTILSDKVVVKNIIQSLGMDIENNSQIINIMVDSYDEIQEVHFKEEIFNVEEKFLSDSEIHGVEPLHEDEKTDGSIHSILIALYIGKKEYNNQPDTPMYTVIATHEWITDPAVRAKDAFSIYADGEAMPHGDIAAHMAGLECTYSMWFSDEQIVGEELSPVIKSGGGVLVECNLSPYVNAYSAKHTDFSVLLLSTYVITDTSAGSKLFRLWTKYVHSWLGIGLDVGWDIGAELPGASITPSFQTTEYGFYMDISTGTDYT